MLATLRFLWRAFDAGKSLHQLQPRYARALRPGAGARQCPAAHGRCGHDDRFVVRPEHGWPSWCAEQLRPEMSDFVLVICTHGYRLRRNIARRRPRAAASPSKARSSPTRFTTTRPISASSRCCSPAPKRAIFPNSCRERRAINIGDFALGDAGFEALYRELTGQPAVVPEPIGEVVPLGAIVAPEPAPAAPTVAPELPPLPTLTSFPPAAAFDISRILDYAPTHLLGREEDTKAIDEAFAAAVGGAIERARVMTFVAMGGRGKTALVADWAARRQGAGWPVARRPSPGVFIRRARKRRRPIPPEPVPRRGGGFLRPAGDRRRARRRKGEAPRAGHRRQTGAADPRWRRAAAISARSSHGRRIQGRRFARTAARPRLAEQGPRAGDDAAGDRRSEEGGAGEVCAADTFAAPAAGSGDRASENSRPDRPARGNSPN